MKIDRVSAVHPVLSIKANKKDYKSNDKQKNEEKEETSFHKTFSYKKKEGEVDEKI